MRLAAILTHHVQVRGADVSKQHQDICCLCISLSRGCCQDFTKGLHTMVAGLRLCITLHAWFRVQEHGSISTFSSSLVRQARCIAASPSLSSLGQGKDLTMRAHDSRRIRQKLQTGGTATSIGTSRWPESRLRPRPPPAERGQMRTNKHRAARAPPLGSGPALGLPQQCQGVQELAAGPSSLPLQARRLSWQASAG